MDTRTLKNIYKKINTKTKLSAIKTQLSAVDDLKEAYASLELITYDTGRSGSLESYTDLPDVAQELRDKIDNLQVVADEFIAFYDELDNISGQANELIDNLQNAMDTYRDLADEVGLDVNENNEYSNALMLMDDAKRNLNETDNLLVQFGDLYSTATDITF
jgi:ABC-type transporter Mla subunit MlaD